MHLILWNLQKSLIKQTNSFAMYYHRRYVNLEVDFDICLIILFLDT